MKTARLEPISSIQKLSDLNLNSALLSKGASRGESPNIIHSPWFSSTIGKDIKGFSSNKKFKLTNSYNKIEENNKDDSDHKVDKSKLFLFDYYFSL